MCNIIFDTHYNAYITQMWWKRPAFPLFVIVVYKGLTDCGIVKSSRHFLLRRRSRLFLEGLEFKLQMVLSPRKDM